MGNSVFILNKFPALGTLFWVEIFQNNKLPYTSAFLASLAIELEQEILQFESKYSRFKTDSVLSLLNSERAVLYDEDLFQMITLGCEAGRLSAGVFDIFIKEKLEQKGYGEQKEKRKGGDASLENDILIKDGYLLLSGNKGIDLGGIGKGYLIDKLAKILHTKSAHFFLINGGGDIYATSDNDIPLEVLVEHPTEQGKFLGKVVIKDRSFCASSSFKRKWNYDGKEVNHFIADKEVWAASYVIAKTSVLADTFATVACIVSTEKKLLENFSHSFSSEYMVISGEGISVSSNFLLETV